MFYFSNDAQIELTAPLSSTTQLVIQDTDFTGDATKFGFRPGTFSDWRRFQIGVFSDGGVTGPDEYVIVQGYQNSPEDIYLGQRGFISTPQVWPAGTTLTIVDDARVMMMLGYALPFFYYCNGLSAGAGSNPPLDGMLTFHGNAGNLGSCNEVAIRQEDLNLCRVDGWVGRLGAGDVMRFRWFVNEFGVRDSFGGITENGFSKGTFSNFSTTEVELSGAITDNGDWLSVPVTPASWIPMNGNLSLTEDDNLIYTGWLGVDFLKAA